jgi:hypothetical protein
MSKRPASSAGPLGRADVRPRIHLWPDSPGWRWSRGPVGARSRPFPTPGQALDGALDEIGQVETVAFTEGVQQHG